MELKSYQSSVRPVHDREQIIAADITTTLDVYETAMGHLRAAFEGPVLKAAMIKAVDSILETKGRLIVVGVGKSGHVGAKLAATFASTGTSAFFVHPTEASHGDLGMIREEDTILMLSWSGETKELRDIIGYAKRFSINLIGMTWNPDSMLGRASTVCLPLPRVPEACPHNLAPTTSTALQLAAGDAIAIALLKARGFSAANFRNFHPGGKLGASLQPIDDLMLTGVGMPIVSQDAPVYDVLAELTAKSFGIVGVIDSEGALIGVVTDGDIRRFFESSASKALGDALWDSRASSIMTTDPVMISSGSMIAEVLGIFNKSKISAAFIVDEARVVGVVSLIMLLSAGAA